jgi:signal peptidase I
MNQIQSQNQNIQGSSRFRQPKQDLKSDQKSNSSGFLRFFELSRWILLVIMFIYIVYLFIFTLFVVSGPSMEPNFHDKEVLSVNKAAYWFKDPKRGDVVIFYFPGQREIKYIKRIIGLPGETVEIKNQHFYINGQYLNDYTPESYPTNILIKGKNQWIVGVGEYFVSGDNRPNSNDSRVWDSLPKSEILGKVELRLYPFGKDGGAK